LEEREDAMKSPLVSLTLIASLTGLAQPVDAQETDATHGPIARAVAREAVRRAADLQVNPAQAATGIENTGIRILVTAAEKTGEVPQVDVAPDGSGASATRYPVSRFAELRQRLGRGDAVYVTDRHGKEIKGIVMDLSATSLGLDVKGSRQSFDENAVREIYKGHSRVNNALVYGLLIGGASSVGGALLPHCTDMYNGCQLHSSQARNIAISTAIGAAIGAAVGAARETKEPIYRAP
jgi:hypothetical protein